MQIPFTPRNLKHWRLCTFSNMQIPFTPRNLKHWRLCTFSLLPHRVTVNLYIFLTRLECFLNRWLLLVNINLVIFTTSHFGLLHCLHIFHAKPAALIHHFSITNVHCMVTLHVLYTCNWNLRLPSRRREGSFFSFTNSLEIFYSPHRELGNLSTFNRRLV